MFIVVFIVMGGAIGSDNGWHAHSQVGGFFLSGPVGTYGDGWRASPRSQRTEQRVGFCSSGRQVPR